MTSQSLSTLGPRELTAAAGRSEIAVSTPATMPLPRIGGPISATLVRWGARRQVKTYHALTEATQAKTQYVHATTNLTQAVIEGARVHAELRELHLTLEYDATMRRLISERDIAMIEREVAEARYGRDATRDEIAELRAKQRKKTAAREKPALNALVKAKQELEALGRDTTAIDDALNAMEQNGSGE